MVKHLLALFKGKVPAIDRISVVFLFCFAVFSFATITTYTLPGYDENYYASSAISYFQDASFRVPFDFPRTGERSEAWHVMLYNVTQGFVFSLFGIGVAQLRFLSVVSGLILICGGWWWVRKTTGSSACGAAFAVLFSTDRAINFMMHTGRMDLRGLVFVLLAFICFEQIMSSSKTGVSRSVKIFCCGALLGIGCLLYLRLAFALVPCVFLPWVYNNPGNGRSHKEIILFGVSAVVFFTLALLGWFGGIQAGADSFASTADTALFSRHFGFSVYNNLLRQSYDIPKLIIFYISMAFLTIRFRDYIVRNFFFLAYFLFTIGFILFVQENGPYRVAFLPFAYTVMLTLFSLAHERLMKLVFGIAIVLVLFGNLVTTTHRHVYLLLNNRALVNWAADVDEKLTTIIPPGVSVLSSSQFHLPLKANNNLVVNIPWYHNTERVSEWLNVILVQRRPEYLVCQIPPQEVFSSVHLEKIVDISPPAQMGPAWMINRLGPKSCAVYRVVR